MIRCCDNIDFLEFLLKENYSIDLVITDPPYNIGKDFGNDSDKQEMDSYISNLKIRFAKVSQLLKEHGSVICFSSHLYVAHIQIMLQEFLQYRRMMIWYYKNGMSRQTNTPVTEYEPFLWFTKSNNWIYNTDDIRVPYKTDRVKSPIYKTNVKGEKIAWMPNPRGAKRGDVWEYPTLAGKLYENEKTEHPTQKPESLITDLIKAFCPKKNDIYEGNVLDIYGGSGTTAVCCEQLNQQGHNINYFSCEIEPKWVNITINRLKTISKNYFLF